ncbi:hypothetical protein CL622_08015 [archaeon]|nr:hypothetical protein [archaeon]|tara:strand:+ start:698 stop:1066 length:369 start_codon:yes stop_codon:yes gene_type:complete
MEIKIRSQQKQPLLSRTDYTFEISGTKKTPKTDEVLSLVTKKCKAKDEVVSIKGIYQRYGASKVEVNAFVYSSKDELLRVEPPKKKKEEKADAKPAEEKATKPEAKPKEETPKEEKAEEKTQ